MRIGLPRPGTLALLATLLVAAPPAAAQSCLCGTAADELVAARAGLDREWVVQVPFDSARSRLEAIAVGDSLVTAQSGDGTIAAISTATAAASPRPGTVAWSTPIEGQPAPVERAGIGATTVAVARGKRLVLLEAATGQTIWERPLRTVASAAPVVSAGWVYVPLDGGGIARFPEDPWATVEPAPEDAADAADAGAISDEPATGPRPGEKLDPIEIGTDGEIDFPLLPCQGGVLWCTTGGRIGAIVRTQAASRRLEFDLGGPASGPPVIRGGDIFVATRAGDVARLTKSPQGLTANSGVMKDVAGEDVAFNGWHTIVDAVPEGGPIVGSDTLVVSLGPSGMAALATATGDLLWQVPACGRPLAITGDRVWCLEETGFLVARDLATGGRRDRLCLGCFTLPVVNATSDRLILASPGGLVVSLAPRRTVAAEPPVPQPPPAASDEAGPEAASAPLDL